METVTPYVYKTKRNDYTHAVNLVNTIYQPPQKRKSPQFFNGSNLDPYTNIGQVQTLENRKKDVASTITERAKEEGEINESMLLHFLELYEKSRQRKERMQDLEEQYKYAGNARMYLVNRALAEEAANEH